MLVRAIRVLVTIVAVFLSYNANTGLPFVPTYDLKANLPNAAELVEGSGCPGSAVRGWVGVGDRAQAARGRLHLHAKSR